MLRSIMSALTLAALAAPAAQADFVVAPLGPATSATVSSSPKASEAPAFSARSEGSRFRVAQGFGDHVPLSFAVRQIVPRAVRVTYGPGVDPDAPVDWKGGQAWNWVLLRAVHPLGLRLVLGPMAVQIRK